VDLRTAQVFGRYVLVHMRKDSLSTLVGRGQGEAIGTVTCDEGVLEPAIVIECVSAGGLHVFDGSLIVLVATLGRPAVPGRMIPQLIKRGISTTVWRGTMIAA
jgi:hypothetical protein